MITLTGQRLTVRDVRAVADGAPVRLDPAALARAAEGHALAVRVAAERTIYGRTTGVGANKDSAVDAAASAEHATRLLHSHATSAGDLREPRRVRATMAIRLNQLAVGGSGARPEVLSALAALLDSGRTPPVREHGGVGTGDLGALATIAVALPGVEWTADDALPFLSSNAATLADAALATADLMDLTSAAIAVTALTFVAVDGAPEAFSATVERVTPYAGVARVAQVVRALTGADRAGARLQDPFALRTAPQVHGLALDTLAELARLVEDATALAAENPVADLSAGTLVHHGGFHAAYLAGALDAAKLALANTAALSVRRVALLLDPHVTGLAPFLGDGTAGASGAMGLEYAAASALGDLRASATPAGLQSVVLSLGVEDDASFASLGARQALAARSPYAVVVACELVGAFRAVRLRGLEPPTDGSGWGAIVQACAALPGLAAGELADRDLTADIQAAAALLPDLAEPL